MLFVVCSSPGFYLKPVSERKPLAGPAVAPKPAKPKPKTEVKTDERKLGYSVEVPMKNDVVHLDPQQDHEMRKYTKTSV